MNLQQRRDEWLAVLLGRINVPFTLASFTIFFSLCWRFPSLSIRAVPYAEGGTLFLNEVWIHGFWATIMNGDMTHLAWLPRLITVVSLQIGGIELFPYVSQGLIFTLISFYASFICLRCCKFLVNSDWSRFLIALALGLAPTYEHYTLINFSYFGLPLLLIFMFLNYQSMHPVFLISLSCLAFLTVTSKSIYVVFLPLYAGAVVLAIWQKKWRNTVINFILFASGLANLFFTLSRPTPSSFPAVQGVWNKIEYATYLGLNAFREVSLLKMPFLSMPPEGISYLIYGTTALMLVLSVFFSFKRKDYTTLMMILASCAVVVATAGIFTITPVYDKPPVNWSILHGQLWVRALGVIVTAAVCGVAAFAGLLIREGGKQALLGKILCAFIGFNALVSFLRIEDPYKNAGFLWPKERDFFKQEHACVPIPPYNGVCW